ncbi:hypothetical protein OWR29_38960 [Actinoplanes sp. Pm04-4]|uniref:Uncharacterized protein n=1 Tax=Paractinoplanes pyxinae TaxID=2997416 RepID=A0ABT4BBX0_9ACTN|nr:hypothetical protein [Actinoplanes pyxinae]MCY1144011.1 hypothetical protein [Actinoplanes pyxinae]
MSAIKAVLVASVTAAAALTAVVMVADFPSKRSEIPRAYFGFRCPNGSSLHMGVSPTIQINLENDRYLALFEFYAVTKGKLPCHVVAELPRGSAVSPSITAWTHRTDGSYAARPYQGNIYDVAVPGAPQEGEDPNANFVSIRFAGSLGFRQEGWGKRSFAMNIGNGQPIISYPFAAPFLGEDDGLERERRALIVKIISRNSLQHLDSAYPSSFQADASQAVEWRHDRLGTGVFSATYENERVRYWADHAIDFFTLAVGALLGVLFGMANNARNAPSESGVSPSETAGVGLEPLKGPYNQHPAPPRPLPGTEMLRRKVEEWHAAKNLK